RRPGQPLLQTARQPAISFLYSLLSSWHALHLDVSYLAIRSFKDLASVSGALPEKALARRAKGSNPRHNRPADHFFRKKDIQQARIDRFALSPSCQPIRNIFALFMLLLICHLLVLDGDCQRSHQASSEKPAM
ncbi:MAG: hypothetical protein ACLFUT_11795, partial [Desulfobacteraceae bacterium]